MKNNQRPTKPTVQDIFPNIPQHTPTPWAHDDGHIFTQNKHGYNSKYNSIARVYDMYADDGTAQPNAQFILKAVNMHDELVKTLQWIGKFITTASDGGEAWCAVRNQDGAKEWGEDLERLLKQAEQK